MVCVNSSKLYTFLIFFNYFEQVNGGWRGLDKDCHRMEKEKKSRLVKYGACGRHRRDEKCVKIVALKMSADCVGGRIILG